jgi:hypothetical protein
MVEASHLLLLEPDAVPVPVQTAVVQGLLLSEDVLPGQLLLLLLLRQLVLVAVAVGRLLRQAVGGGWQQALQKGFKQRGLIYIQSISHKVVFTRCATRSFMSSESFRQQMDSSARLLYC